MRANLKYLCIVLRHKWYVFLYGYRLDVPWWRLITHDLSKFSRAEFGPYRDRFVSGRAGKEDKSQDTAAFANAWRHHWQHNPHHWEYWLDDSVPRSMGAGTRFVAEVIEMPDTYAREMVADWQAAGKVYSGGGETELRDWYNATKDKRMLHPKTLKFVEWLMGMTWY